MMLKSLQSRDADEAQELLTDLTGRLLPSPSNDELSSIDDPKVESLLLDILKRLQIPRGDISSEDRARIYDFLVDQLLDLSLDNKRARAARERVGHRGLLRPSQYRITFAAPFARSQEAGVRRSHVEAALRKPADVEHLSADTPERFGVSLFTSSLTELVEGDPFILLITCSRKKDLLTVTGAWRVYLSDLPAPTKLGARDLLHALVDRFGVDFETPAGIRRLVLGEVFNYRGNIEKALKVRAEERKLIGAHFVIEQDANSITVEMAFAIDHIGYLNKIRQHGVEIGATDFEIAGTV